VRKQRELEAYIKKCLLGAATDRRKKVIAQRLNKKQLDHIQQVN
jgi:hypothetical protein